ncbi:unnamed protein product [Prorocentrum cordatum]|uniref:LNR domain-containing protein n=1 Tax=Prorocentrum cordatum TaxID=2364126 RepID=A0ABN9UAV4_9DINO|nr:unnamed protein product [Polarella glacialis]
MISKVFGGLCCEACSSEATTTTDKELCADGCYNGWPGDGYCDSVCNNWECNYDGGDCDATPEPEPEPEPEWWTTTDKELCADGCYNGWPGDGYCDSVCNNWECNYDGGDCDENPPTDPEGLDCGQCTDDDGDCAFNVSTEFPSCGSGYQVVYGNYCCDYCDDPSLQFFGCVYVGWSGAWAYSPTLVPLLLGVTAVLQ